MRWETTDLFWLSYVVWENVVPGYCWSPNKTHTTCGSITADKGVSSIHTITVYKEQKHRNTYTHWKIIATRHSSLLLLVTRPQMLDTSFQELDLDFVHTNTHTKCMCARTPPPPIPLPPTHFVWKLWKERMSTGDICMLGSQPRMRMVKYSIWY